MAKNIIEVFKDHAEHITADVKLIKNLRRYRIAWANKNIYHVEFLASNLIGVHPIRFTKEDEHEFFDRLLEIDEKQLYKDLIKLDEIYAERNVTSNVFYITCVYIMHLITVSKMSVKDKNQGLEEIYTIMAYKMFSSLSAHYFKFDLDIDIATIIYETISNRYLIKKVGSWNEVFRYRAKDVMIADKVKIKENGLHYERLVTFTTLDATKIIMDLQGRLRSIMKELFAVFIKINEKNEKRLTTSKTVSDVDGNDMIANVENINKEYFDYINQIIFDKKDFIKDDIVYIVSDMFKNVQKKELYKTLEFISAEAIKNHKTIHELVLAIMKANVSYLHSAHISPPYDERIVNIVKHLKGFWSSSKVKDKNLLFAKSELKKLAKEATGKKTDWLLVSLAMSVSVYIFIRAVVKSKYK